MPFASATRSLPMPCASPWDLVKVLGTALMSA